MTQSTIHAHRLEPKQEGRNIFDDEILIEIVEPYCFSLRLNCIEFDQRLTFRNLKEPSMHVYET